MGADDERSLLLAVDIGTTACKAGVFSKDGTVKALSYQEYPLIHLADHFIEQDAELWWKLTMRALRTCVAQIDTEQRRYIKALGLSAQGISIVPVDARGDPVANAISWLDSRAEREALALRTYMDASAIFKTTGIPPSPCFMLPKIMWLQKNRPDIYAASRRICTCQDFIIHRLTGDYVTDHSIAGGSLMYDMRSCAWSDALLSFARVSPEKLPRLAWAGEVIGPVRPEVAETLLLPEHVLVVLGGHDQQCAGVGGGLREGRMTASLGTASIILGSLPHPVWDDEMRIPCLASVEKEQWVLEAAVSVGGAGLRWLRDALRTFAGGVAPNIGEKIDYTAFTKLAASAEQGSDGVLFFPHMTGATAPYWQPASGMFYGLTLAAGIPQMARAIMEGWCFQIRHNVRVIQQLTRPADDIVVFGGGAKSEFLIKLLADVLNMPVLVTNTPETALLGAAMVAGVGGGVYPNMRKAQNDAVHISKTVLPDTRSANHYQSLFERYIFTEKLLLDVHQRKERRHGKDS